MFVSGTIAAVSDKGILGVSQQGGKLFFCLTVTAGEKSYFAEKGDGPEEYNVIQRVDVGLATWWGLCVLGSLYQYMFMYLMVPLQTDIDTKANIRD